MKFEDDIYYKGQLLESYIGGALLPPNFLYSSIKIVQTIADFPAPIGRDIFLEDKIYFIDSNNLDITGYTLNFGTKSQINGYGQNVSVISSSESGTPGNPVILFKSATNLFMNDLEIYCFGQNQLVWYSEDDAIVPEGVSFELNRFAVFCFQPHGHGNKLGYIANIRQGFMGTMFFLGFDDGFELAGHFVNGGFRIDNTLFRNCIGKMYYSSPTSPVLFDSRFASNANINIPTGSIGYDFPPTAFQYSGQYQLQNGNVSGTGQFVTDWSGKSPAYDPKGNFRNNTGIQDTYPGGEWINTVDTTTTVVTTNVWYDLNLLTSQRDLAWFTEVNGVWTYEADTPLDVQLTLTVSVTGNTNNIIEIKIVKEDSLLVQTDLLSRSLTIQGTLAQGKAESIVITTTTKLNYLDKVKILGRNTSAAQNFSILKDSNCIIQAK